VFARRALAPARVSKVMSDHQRQVITSIVDEDQLSLAIGRNGQNVRLASQLIGWQIDLYGSREWLERGADLSLFGGGEETMEMADFPLAELELEAATLAALESAGYSTFLDIIDLERGDLLKVEGLGEEEADRILGLIDELTVVEGEPSEVAAGDVIGDTEASGSEADAGASESEGVEARAVAGALAASGDETESEVTGEASVAAEESPEETG
jgi:N utilization substance protein A